MRARVLAVAAVVTLTAACGGGGDDGRTSLTVLAAASLTEAFDAVVQAFETEHPGVDVTTSYAGSSALAAQVDAGGPGDVVVTADRRTIDGVAGASVVVARNRLAIVVEEGNPRALRALADLARDDLVVVLCAPEVPCGRYARSALAAAGVDVEPRSLEENVKAVVAKVALGEADAGIVYATDVRAAEADVDGIEIEGPPPAAYHAAAVNDREVARAFVEFLGSAGGQRLLEDAGFLPA